MSLVVRGTTACTHCGRDGDLKEPVRCFPVFGNPEALFGLDVWHGTKDIPPSTEHRIVLWDIHVAQVNTCLKLSAIPVGLLVTFNVRVLKHGLRRLWLPRPTSSSPSLHVPPSD